MALREEFERSCVPEYILAQAISADVEEGDCSPQRTLELTGQLFPAAAYKIVSVHVRLLKVAPSQHVACDEGKISLNLNM